MNGRKSVDVRRGWFGGIPNRSARVEFAKTQPRKAPKIAILTLLTVIFAITASYGAMIMLSAPADEVPAAITYNVRSTIVINNDGQFNLSNGVTSGSGTSGDPYIIDNWDITASTNHAITINNTRAFFEIRSCYLHGGKANSWDGIIMTNVMNGTIKSNVIQGNYHGVHLDVSNWDIVHANNISDNNLDGIYLDGCHNDSITNNSIWKNSWNGIFFSISHNNTAYNNTCNSNTIDGIYLEASSDNRIDWNNCSRNLNDGVRMYWNCNRNQVFQNVITNNTYYGCEINHGAPVSCAGNMISENTFMFNNGALAYPVYSTLTIQGYDNSMVGAVNFWSVGGMGNYWNDWTAPDVNPPGGDGIVDNPYNLDPVPYMTNDALPLTNWVVIPEPPVFILVGIIILVFIGMVRMKKN